jgi:N utilization substance protein B
MTTRRRAREIVLQLLYEDDLNPNHDPNLADGFIAKRLLGNKPLTQFARELLGGVRKNRYKVDQMLSQRATNWSLRRMSAIDRNILRMAAFEMVYAATPGRVAINEAVEIAKRYGGKNSGTFVNGVLDRVLREVIESQEGKDDESKSPDSKSPDSKSPDKKSVSDVPQVDAK